MAIVSWEITLTYEDHSLPLGSLEFKGSFTNRGVGGPSDALNLALTAVYERFDLPNTKCTEVRMVPELTVD